MPKLTEIPKRRIRKVAGKFIDSHAHLDDDRFEGDRDEIINSLYDNDIEAVLNPGADLKSSKDAVLIAEKYPFIYAAVGCHPHDSKYMSDESMNIFKEMAKNNKVIAIGEIGLDYYYDNSDRVTQRKWFREQIRLAKELDLPYIVHDRDAHEDILNIMKEEYYDGVRGIMHCYSGSVELSREFLKLGFYISLGGPVTYKNARVPKLVAKEVPFDRLLIETDSPYLTPAPFRGKRNEPKYVKYVAEEIAGIRNLSVDDLSEKTRENFKRLFNLRQGT
ncbi:MAG TPA: TatD family hydrolase [Sedimentibacter sp.]|nr:TatD family hydrolase [Sedimentibacter sp.]HNZ82302.1 TatD family hydrolase [Sedimentibacter sp.]HOH69351.1 TatD family hydrolase [Sedimentibacter sp.]HPW99448.1 TatD family hydrolase [Sedimentibacter sp.]HQB62991.1 TatD family hydrolase [Sedimentibacter sp.]